MGVEKRSKEAEVGKQAADERAKGGGGSINSTKTISLSLSLSSKKKPSAMVLLSSPSLERRISKIIIVLEEHQRARECVERDRERERERERERRETWHQNVERSNLN